MIIEKYRNYLRGKRLFLDKSHKKQFLNIASNNLRIALIRQLATLRLNYDRNEVDEIEHRCNNLKKQGLATPENVRECNQMIDDLQKWVYK